MLSRALLIPTVAAIWPFNGGDECTPPEGTEGADDGNPHCWDRIRRCDGPNAHPEGGVGYEPACGACEGLGGTAFGDKNEQVTLPKCTPLDPPGADEEPVRPNWAQNNGGKFSVESDRFIMIGKKTDPFCFSFFPSNNSVGNQCYRRQTGTLNVDMSGEHKTLVYDLQIHIPWPSDKHSLFGNISTKIVHHGRNMWVVNNLYHLVNQCVCIEPHSTDGHGGHNPLDVFPVIYNWTNHLQYLARERLEIEYGVGEMDVDHWIFGPHHAWTPVGSSQIVRMWQPYNGFEMFEPGSVKDGVIDADTFGNIPPDLCVKGGALARIGCTDEGYPSDSVHPGDTPDMSPDPEPSDLARARTKVPRATHKGEDFKSMSEKLNSIIKQYGNTKECAEWTAVELQRFQLVMMLMKAPELDELYQDGNDRRAMRGDEDAHGKRWEELLNLAKKLGDKHEEIHRDGHCHEAVMWFAHHIPENLRQEIANRMAVPLLPYIRHAAPEYGASSDEHRIHDEYLAQVTCQDCHQDGDVPAVTV
jgi:hypothetical protein